MLCADPDAVIVCTANAALTSVAETCIRAGKHVLVERPGAASTTGSLPAGGAVGRAGTLVRAGYNHRYHPAFRKAREIVDSGSLGALMFIRARYGRGGRVGGNRGGPARFGDGMAVRIAGRTMPWTKCSPAAVSMNRTGLR